MAGPRGYHNYRGRTPKGKIVLAVVLVLVILASIAVMVFQRNIVYGRDGKPYLDLPWGQETQEPDTFEEDELDLTIQEPEKPKTFTAFSVSGELLTSGDWRTARTEAQTSAVRQDAICVTLKDSAGLVYFDASAAVPNATKTAATTAADLAAITGDEHGYTIARLSCFLDPKAAAADVENLGLKNTGGFLFYDGNNSQWLDPAKPAARQYLCDLAGEAAELGFDEILLTDVSYPTAGKLDKIADGGVSRAETLCAFLEEMRAALEPYGVALSVELPDTVISEGADETAGLDLAKAAPLVDRVYAVTTAENIPALREAVAAASPKTDFVAELAKHSPDVTGSCLILN